MSWTRKVIQLPNIVNVDSIVLWCRLWVSIMFRFHSLRKEFERVLALHAKDRNYSCLEFTGSCLELTAHAKDRNYSCLEFTGISIELTAHAKDRNCRIILIVSDSAAETRHLAAQQIVSLYEQHF